MAIPGSDGFFNGLYAICGLGQKFPYNFWVFRRTERIAGQLDAMAKSYYKWVRSRDLYRPHLISHSRAVGVGLFVRRSDDCLDSIRRLACNMAYKECVPEYNQRYNYQGVCRSVCYAMKAACSVAEDCAQLPEGNHRCDRYEIFWPVVDECTGNAGVALRSEWKWTLSAAVMLTFFSLVQKFWNVRIVCRRLILYVIPLLYVSWVMESCVTTFWSWSRRHLTWFYGNVTDWHDCHHSMDVKLQCFAENRGAQRRSGGSIIRMTNRGRRWHDWLPESLVFIFGIDKRSLAFFRIFLSIVIIADMFQRWWEPIQAYFWMTPMSMWHT